jgi:hypothetical protein
MTPQPATAKIQAMRIESVQLKIARRQSATRALLGMVQRSIEDEDWSLAKEQAYELVSVLTSLNDDTNWLADHRQ